MPLVEAQKCRKQEHLGHFILVTVRDIPGKTKERLNATDKRISETTKSAQLQGDRIWVVRFAKVHKGLFWPRWMQTEEAFGAALDGREEEKSLGEVL